MRTLAATLLGGVLAAAPLLAQAPAPKAPPAKAPAAAKAPEYDPKAEVTFKGTIEDFHESQLRGDHPGLHLVVKTETESIEVHACPVRFMKELDFALDKGDAVTVIGSRPGGTGVVVAREIAKGQTSLTLREKNGDPIWVGR
ncbi:MAG: hypothetical protein U0599_11115 [Vicinamibacteria bacterium]